MTGGRATARVRVKFSAAEIRDLRRRVESGESVASIAREHGLSRQRVHQLLGRANPTGKKVAYTCARCRETWESTAVDRPERCAACGTYDWDE